MQIGLQLTRVSILGILLADRFIVNKSEYFGDLLLVLFDCEFEERERERERKCNLLKLKIAYVNTCLG